MKRSNNDSKPSASGLQCQKKGDTQCNPMLLLWSNPTDCNGFGMEGLCTDCTGSINLNLHLISAFLLLKKVPALIYKVIPICKNSPLTLQILTRLFSRAHYLFFWLREAGWHTRIRNCGIPFPRCWYSAPLGINTKKALCRKASIYLATS